MKKRIQHCILVLFILFIIAGGISIFLNNVSFNHDFSMADTTSGATKKAHHGKNKIISEWNYSRDDIALADTEYVEELVTVGKNTYRVLRKDSDTADIVILSNKENGDYQRAVKNIAGYLESQGYHVRIKECSEVMMLSLAHAGHFNVFLMSEEVR